MSDHQTTGNGCKAAFETFSAWPAKPKAQSYIWSTVTSSARKAIRNPSFNLGHIEMCDISRSMASPQDDGCYLEMNFTNGKDGRRE